MIRFSGSLVFFFFFVSEYFYQNLRPMYTKAEVPSNKHLFLQFLQSSTISTHKFRSSEMFISSSIRICFNAPCECFRINCKYVLFLDFFVEIELFIVTTLIQIFLLLLLGIVLFFSENSPWKIHCNIKDKSNPIQSSMNSFFSSSFYYIYCCFFILLFLLLFDYWLFSLFRFFVR